MIPPVRGLISLLIATGSLLATAAPAAAQEDCGEVVEAEAVLAQGESEAPPLAIGDSPMLLAVPDLAAAGFDVNAHGCRQYEEGLAVLEEKAAAGELPGFVVVALGSNGSVATIDLERARAILGPDRILGLVTMQELSGEITTDPEIVRFFAEEHPDRVVLIDWFSESEGHESWFQPDGVHLTEKGAQVFADRLAAAAEEAGALGGSVAIAEPAVETEEAAAEDDGGGFPVGPILIVVVLIALTLALMRRRTVVRRRSALRADRD